MRAIIKIWFPLTAWMFLLHQCDKEPGPHDPVNIPDLNFLNALITNGFDTNFNKKISFFEAEAITLLDVNRRGITDLTGIEAMVNLQTLYCYNNDIANLEVSKNVVLRTLDCSDNELEILDFSNNPELSFLNCTRNRLTSLDVSKNAELKFLWCGNNPLVRLDISNNPGLGSEWDYTANEGVCYDEVDLSNMPSLQEVCVWTIPFPPSDREICVDAAGSPNIYFTTDCSD